MWKKIKAKMNFIIIKCRNLFLEKITQNELYASNPLFIRLSAIYE